MGCHLQPIRVVPRENSNALVPNSFWGRERFIFHLCPIVDFGIKMPQLTMFLYGEDFTTLLNWLNNEPDIAFIVTDSHNRWKAVHHIDHFDEGFQLLWHIPSGDLPIAPRPGPIHLRPQYTMVKDPWTGWDDPYAEERQMQRLAISGINYDQVSTGKISVADFLTHPYFRKQPNIAQSTVTMDLNLYMKSYMPNLENVICKSWLHWRGNYYRSIGYEANPLAVKWWARCKRWITKQSVRVTSVTYTPHPFAFPAAYELIRNGAKMI